MPREAHSIAFSRPSLSNLEVLERFWSCLRARGAKGGGEYALHWLGDAEDTKTIADVSGLSRDEFPSVVEDESLYNVAEFPFWIEAHEFVLSVRRTFAPVRYGLQFSGNAVQQPGPRWLTRIMGDLVVALDLECSALLSIDQEEYDTEQRRKNGESLVDIVHDRALGKTDLGFPLLALFRHETVDPELWTVVPDLGHRIGVIRGDWVMISSIHD